ncbi:MAG: patatin-like phospholipase family protein [Cyanophyceae cyanobacterium]
MNQKATPHFGLVLAGGGAKGAYQVGALTYLAELGIQPQIIAGTSIGALNGGVLAANGSFENGVQRVNEVWDRLGSIGIIRRNQPATYFKGGQQLTSRQEHLQSAIFDPKPIEQVLRAAIKPNRLRRGTEFWVAVFPSLNLGASDWLVEIVRARTGTKAHWLCVRDFADDQMFEVLLASAAIPLAFPSREINGQCYADGGLADNVPLGALAARGCTHAIVIHLGNGATWNRHNFPGQIVIEIRPELPIQESATPAVGLAKAFFDFSTVRINLLRQRGYEDAQRCLEPLIKSFASVQQQQSAQRSLLNSTQNLLDDLPL